MNLGVKAAANAKSVGWYTVHATNCSPYSDGVTTWVYVYPAEGGYWFTSNNLFANAFLNQCVTGNYIGIYVYDTFGDFNQIYTYSYK